MTIRLYIKYIKDHEDERFLVLYNKRVGVFYHNIKHDA